MRLLDCHNHLQDPRFDPHRDSILAKMRALEITRCVVNGTREQDWNQVAELATNHPDLVIPSFGLHPWYLNERTGHWQDTLRESLELYPEALVGECGLDRWMKDPNLDLQKEVFEQHLDLAIDYRRPVTIHCLRAWGPLLDLLEARPTLPRILLHSFSGSLETARQLEKFDAWFSFSGYFLHPRKEKIRDVFRNLPKDRILVETDAPEMLPPLPTFPLDELNHPANLPEIARQLSGLLNISETQLTKNACAFLNLPQ